jgi:simple sugar transport system permease protein
MNNRGGFERPPVVCLSEVGEVVQKFLSRFLSHKSSFTLIVFVLLLFIFAMFTPGNRFVTPNNLSSLAKLVPDLGVVALGVGVLMICGEFDLSIGSIIPMSSFIFVKLLESGVPLFIIPFITLLVGAALGLLNGLLVVKVKLPSFIATLGTMMFWRGILYLSCRMMPIGIRAYLEPGSWLEHLFIGRVAGVIPVQIFWLILVSIMLGLLLHRHKFGNWIFATGDNQTAARAMGVNTNGVKVACFILVGVLCSFMSMMQSLRIESFAATQGIGFELKAIASAVVGGTSLMGGIGSMFGIFLGTLTIQILENGLILLGTPVFGINAYIGIGIVLFAILNIYIERVAMK